MMDSKAERTGLTTGACVGLGGASLGIAFALWTSEAVSTPLFLGLMLIPITLFAIALRNIGQLKNSGVISPAIWRYQRDFFASIAVYMLGLGVAIALWNHVPEAREYAFAIALLPTLPTLAMVYVMARYVSEEEDEFLRFRTMQSAIIGLGFVLVLGSFWGFMATFDIVPNIWAWWVVPVWAIGFGLGQVWLMRRDNSEDSAS